MKRVLAAVIPRWTEVSDVESVRALGIIKHIVQTSWKGKKKSIIAALSNNESVANSDSKEDGRALLGCIMDDVALNAMVHEKLENDVKNDVLLPAPSTNGAGVD